MDLFSTRHSEAVGNLRGGGQIQPVAVIPDEINDWDRLRAAKFYHGQLNWAVHALYPKDRGTDHEQGKRPIGKGWREHRASEVTADYLEKHFAPGTNYNVGAVVRAPFVHVDLDSKADCGESVRKWLGELEDLMSVPRERTAGGAHLLFICRDLPDRVLAAKKPLVSVLNPRVQAELYKDGNNIVLSPSIHKSGNQYHWEVTGVVPEVRWNELKSWFRFEEPAEKRRGRAANQTAWWTKYRGDLRSLDIIAVSRELRILGERVGGEESKWAVRCPWESEHSTPAPQHRQAGSDAVVFEGESGQHPGFHCMHAHCANRQIEHFLGWAEVQVPGIVDRHCRRERVWSEGQCAQDGRPRVVLPGLDRPLSHFAWCMGAHIGPRHNWFRRSDVVVTVETRRISEKVLATVFRAVQPSEACSAVEEFVETGSLLRDEGSGEVEFVANSMTRECAGKLLVARPFVSQLPEVIRILDVPMPILTKGEIVVEPKPGYNPDLLLYVDPGAPIPQKMALEDAKSVLTGLIASFPFRDDQSRIHALARIITPFCRGIMGWDARFPLWFYVANRPRAGKDYLAGIAHIIYEGTTCEDAPLGRESEETRKRITAAVMAGRRMMHFANCQFHIDDPNLTEAITQKVFAARNIGSTAASADIRLPMEIEFSLSANIGLTYREDLGPRTRQIHLAFYEEDANGRRFPEPDLHGRVLRERPRVLGAVKALLDNWIAQGCPEGPTPFNSAAEWGRVVGGIMIAGGLGDPCLPHAEDGGIGGDLKTKAMRAVFQAGFGKRPGEWFTKGDLFEMIQTGDEDDFDFFGKWSEDNGRAAKKRLGMALTEFRNRELSGIRLELDGSGKGAAQRLRFTQVERPDRSSAPVSGPSYGNPGNLGNITPPSEALAKSPGGICAYDPFISRDVGEGVEVSRVSEVSNRRVSNWQLVTTPADLCNIAGEIARSAAPVALDLETYGSGPTDGLDPWRGQIRLLSLCIKGRNPWLIDLRAVGYRLGPLGEALANTMVVGHNVKFDALWLTVKCGLSLPRCFCTMTAARLLSAGTLPGNNLDQCLERYLGLRPGPDHSRGNWGGITLVPEMLAYAARDVLHLSALREELESKLATEGLGQVAELEMGLIPVVVGMEVAGMQVEREGVVELEAAARKRVQDATEELRAVVGMRDLNPSSPEQIKSALNAAGISVEDTAEATLKASDDGRVVPLILAIRAQSKLAQQARSLVESIGLDGRIHGRFDPTGTATGRFSSHGPNMQNIPRGDLRRCFTAPSGRRLIIADYSQIELRAAAQISGEARMIQAFAQGEDLHRTTAAAILGKPIDGITSHDRQLAKAVNFGLIYGQSAKGLIAYAEAGYGVKLAQDEAVRLRDRFFEAYPKIKAWHEGCWKQVRDGVSEARTIYGRRRFIPAEAKEWNRFTALVNTPVQGTCADGIKIALRALAECLPATSAIVGTVHDEIIVEAQESEADGVRDLVDTLMRDSMGKLLPDVLIGVEAKIARRWSER